MTPAGVALIAEAACQNDVNTAALETFADGSPKTTVTSYAEKPRPITFTRPDPTQFVLLVTKTGRGTVTVVGTENFKPSGTEWATEDDLREAGFVAYDAVRRIAENIQHTVDEALHLLVEAPEPGLVATVRLGDALRAVQKDAGRLLPGI